MEGYDLLPEKVYPNVVIEEGVDYCTPIGIKYGNASTYCKRVFNIIGCCEYVEYLESYSGQSFQLVNAELRFTILEGISANQLFESYPDMINPRELCNIDRVADTKRVMREDIFKPLVRKDIMCSEIDKASMDRLFNLINDLSRKVTKLEKDNDILKQQINELIDGQVPKELTSGILENMFEENT